MQIIESVMAALPVFLPRRDLAAPTRLPGAGRLSGGLLALGDRARHGSARQHDDGERDQPGEDACQVAA